jgi:hypothetical protein
LKQKKGDFHLCKTVNCNTACIDKKFLLSAILFEDAEKILSQLKTKSSIGRPKIEFYRELNEILYVLKTGIKWNALPRCFDSN